MSCHINDENITKLKYKSILEYVYSLINDGSRIIENTKLNIKTVEKIDEGFYYLAHLGINVQGIESNKCLSKIVNQCLINEINIIMQINCQMQLQ